MTSWCLAIENNAGSSYWTYGNPGKWTRDKAKARLYARQQSAIHARFVILKHRKDIQADTLKVLEVIEP